MQTRVARAGKWAQNRVVTNVDDLDELQVVTKREYRRGYVAQVNGNPRRLRYRKLMRTPDGQYVVCRPALGDERRKTTARDVLRGVGIFLLVEWPVTLLALLGLAILIALATR